MGQALNGVQIMGNLLSKCKKLEKSDWGNCSVGEASPASWSDSNSRAY